MTVAAAALVLAAGASRRMGAANKLLAAVDADGRPMVAAVAAMLQSSAADSVTVVTGHQAALVRRALAGLGCRFVHNGGHQSGMGASLSAGVAAVAADGDVDAVVVCLGDMPLVSAATVDALIAAFDDARGAAACVPVCGGRRGNPVLFGRRFFPELIALGGDRGARFLLQKHAQWVREVAVDDAGVLADADTPAEVKKITAAVVRQRR